MNQTKKKCSNKRKGRKLVDPFLNLQGNRGKGIEKERAGKERREE